jgi:hypothetical protein
MGPSSTIDDQAHPAPHRDRVRLIELVAALVGPPLAWSLHLVANYGFASRACFPDGAPLVVPSFGRLWLVLIAIDVASLIICAAAAAIAYRNWARSAEELAETESAMVETGEGRTRFLAVWGFLVGIGFFVAVVFDFVGLWIVPICG